MKKLSKLLSVLVVGLSLSFGWLYLANMSTSIALAADPPPAVDTPAAETPPPADTFVCDKTHLGTPGLADMLNQHGCSGKNPIFALIETIVNWMIKLLGSLAVLALIIAGIQYSTSQGNPDGIKKAKARITNAVVGIIMLVLMFFILNTLIGLNG